MKCSFEVRVSRERGTNCRSALRCNIIVIGGASTVGKAALHEAIADYMRQDDDRVFDKSRQ